MRTHFLTGLCSIIFICTYAEPAAATPIHIGGSESGLLKLDVSIDGIAAVYDLEIGGASLTIPLYHLDTPFGLEDPFGPVEELIRTASFPLSFAVDGVEMSAPFTLRTIYRGCIPIFPFDCDPPSYRVSLLPESSPLSFVFDLGTAVLELAPLGANVPLFQDTASNIWSGDGYLFGRATLRAPAPIPEPITLFLFGTGLVGLMGYSRRRGK